ncbi:hypothetical protein ACLQ2R_27800 [Streptosporangium sp. DT93]
MSPMLAGVVVALTLIASVCYEVCAVAGRRHRAYPGEIAGD